MPEKEYQAGMRLEIVAHDLRKETGANQLLSLVHAALRVADTKNFTVISRLFPKVHQELMMFKASAQYDRMDVDLVTVARLLARARQMMGIGIKLYEISTEIANGTGGSVDDIHKVLSQHYNEIVLPVDEV